MCIRDRVIASVLEAKFMRKAQNFFRSVYFIPSLLMVTVVGITFKMIYSPSIGLINPLLELAGIDTSNIDLLGNAGSATYAIAAMSQWQYIGYTVILFIVAIQNIPEDLYEAADIDGANAIKKFFFITLPEIKDTILINTIITVTGSIREYDEVFVTTKGLSLIHIYSIPWLTSQALRHYSNMNNSRRSKYGD